MAKPFNVRMEAELRSQIDERVVAGEASNASEWAREALAGVVALGGLPKLAAALDLMGAGRLDSPHPPRALQLQRSTKGLRVLGTAECAHPADQRVQTPFETRCGACWVVIDPETGLPAATRPTTHLPVQR